MFDSVTGYTCHTSEILERNFKKSADVKTGIYPHCRLPFEQSGPSFQQPRYPALIPYSLRFQGNSARMKN